MLNVVAELPPFGAEQWTNLAMRNNEHLPKNWPGRDDDSLRHKFKNYTASQSQEEVKVPSPRYSVHNVATSSLAVATRMTVIRARKAQAKLG